MARSAEGARRALLIATSEYADPRLQELRAPASEVHELAEILSAPAIGNYDVEMVLDRPRQDVESAIEEFFVGSSPRDTLLLYISGHGVLGQDGGLYFAAADTRLRTLRSRAVSAEFVRGTMSESRSRTQVLLLDCCHSGAFAEGRRPKSAPSLNFEKRFDGTGQITLTASGELEYAFEAESVDQLEGAPWKSVFTSCLVEGLQSGAADLDLDGDITVDELYEYVHRHVTTREPRQNPLKSGSVDGVLLFAHSSHRSPVPVELRKVLESPIAGLRRAAVVELRSLLDEASTEERKPIEAALGRRLHDDDPKVRAAASAVLAGEDVEARAPEPVEVSRATGAARESVDAYKEYIETRRARAAVAAETTPTPRPAVAETTPTPSAAKTTPAPRAAAAKTTPAPRAAKRESAREKLAREAREAAAPTQPVPAAARPQPEPPQPPPTSPEEAQRRRQQTAKVVATVAAGLAVATFAAMFAMSFAGVEDSSPSPYAIGAVVAFVSVIVAGIASGMSD